MRLLLGLLKCHLSAHARARQVHCSRTHLQQYALAKHLCFALATSRVLAQLIFGLRLNNLCI